jgi:hypothetical protein
MVRPDRDEYIKVYWENIKNKADGKVLEKWPANTDVDYSSPYDFNSIMHYRYDALARDKGVTVLESKKPGVQLPRESTGWPSQGDLDAICSIYTCECPQAKKPSNCK